VIEDAGFDLANDTRAGARPSGTSDSVTHSLRAEKHLKQCQFCRNKFGSGHDALERARPAASSQSDLLRQPTFKDQLLQEAAKNGIDHSCNVPHRLTLSVGGMTCGSCITAVTQALSVIPGVHDISVSLLNNSATATLDNKNIVPDVVEAVTTIGYEADVVSIQPLNMNAKTVEMDGPLHVSLSVGGMASVADSSTITRLLSRQEGVSDVSVNLVGNSVSFVLGSKELLPTVQGIIASAGLEASVVNMEPVRATRNTEEVTRGQRTVNLHIVGMHSE
jgi:copper chaperone CopZ